MTALYQKIKALREAKGLSQAELGRRLSVSRNAINGYESATSTPSPPVLLALARELGTSVDYLLSNDAYANIDISGLGVDDVKMIKHLIEHLKNKNTPE